MAGIRTCDRGSQVQRPNHYTTEPPVSINFENIPLNDIYRRPVSITFGATPGLITERYLTCGKLSVVPSTCVIHSMMCWGVPSSSSLSYLCQNNPNLNQRSQLTVVHWLDSLAPVVFLLSTLVMVHPGKRSRVCRTLSQLAFQSKIPRKTYISTLGWCSFTAHHSRNRVQ